MKQGKIFLYGLLIMYLIAGMTALVLLAVSFGNLPDEIGRHQGALLSAYQRADNKRFFLESAATGSFRSVTDTLYTDQNAYFGEAGGEVESGCGTYQYSLWSSRVRDDCLLDEATSPTREYPTTHLQQNIEPRIGEQTNQHPLGPFTILFSLTTEFLTDEVRLRFNAKEPLPVEPILRGITAGQGVGDVIRGSVGAVEGLTWPRAPSGSLERHKRITSCFGPRQLSYAASDEHMGFDLPSTTATKTMGGVVVAAADGIVINNPQATAYGTVLIKHPPKTPGGRVLYTRYLHLKNERPTDIRVRQNQPVRAGQPIGFAWDTAAPDRPHLHFEVLIERDGITKTPHMYAPGSADVSHLYALNPVCFFSRETLKDVIIRTEETTHSCAKQDDPLTAYCNEYGIEFIEDGPQNASSPTEQPSPNERLSAGMPSLDSGAPVSASSQDLARTYSRMQDLKWGQYVVGAAAKHTVPQSLILGVITQESTGNPEAISYTGCCAGLMQIHHLNAESYAGNAGLDELPRATACWQCGAGDWSCPGSDCTGTSDPDCRCTENNDNRFDERTSIYAGAELLAGYLKQHAHRQDRIEFALAEYNAGGGPLKSWIAETGETDENVRWSDVASVLQKKQNPPETLEYVPNVLAYCQAWNDGTPCSEGTGSIYTSARKEGLTLIGEYTWNPTFWVEVPDIFTPFGSIIDWAKLTLQRCNNDPQDPERCLLRESFDNDPMITSFDREAKQNASYRETVGTNINLEGFASSRNRAECSEDPIQSYFDRLALALRDCAENLQWNCTCPLPEPPSITGDERFNVTLTLETKETTAEGVEPPDFTSIEAGLLVGESIHQESEYHPLKDRKRLTFILDKRGLTWEYRYYEEERVREGFRQSDFFVQGDELVIEKQTSIPNNLTFRDPTSYDEACAVIKTKYAFCANVTDDAPLLSFALENTERRPPPSPTTPPPLLANRAQPKGQCFVPCNYWVCVNGVPTGAVNPSCDPPYFEVPQQLETYYDPLSGYFLLKQPELDQALYLVYQRDPRSIPSPSNPFNKRAHFIVGQLRHVRDADDKPYQCLLFNIDELESTPTVPNWREYAGDLYFVPVDRAGNANLRQRLRVRVAPLRDSQRDWHPLDDDEIPRLGAPAYSDDKGRIPEMSFVLNWQNTCPELAPILPFLLGQPGSETRVQPVDENWEALWDRIPRYKREVLERQYETP